MITGRILVTGSLGTLGRPLVAELRRRGHDVWGLDLHHCADPKYHRADIRCREQVDQAIDEIGPALVFHLAAEFGRHNGEEFYQSLWTTNVVGTRHILEIQRDSGFRLVFASSSEIYGDMDTHILREDLAETRPLKHPNDYAMTKWVNERQIVNMSAQYNLEVMRLRLFNAYGPGEHYHPYRSAICLFVHAALTGRVFPVFVGYGRVFMYIDDLIQTLANCVDRFQPGWVGNVGGREYALMEDVAAMVIRLTGADPYLIQRLPQDQHNTKSKRPDIGRACVDLGHDPKTLLTDGLPKTIAWMRDHL